MYMFNWWGFEASAVTCHDRKVSRGAWAERRDRRSVGHPHKGVVDRHLVDLSLSLSLSIYIYI